MSSSPLLVAAAGLLGLLLGSFVNVVAYRLPAGRSVVRPGSACPPCGTPLRAWENVPVLSWLLLRGRCSTCRAQISARYPVVELLTAGICAVLALRLGFSPALPAFLVLGVVGMTLALIDIDTHRLPNVLTLPSYAVGIVLLGMAALISADASPFLRALLGMVALFAVYFLLALAYPAGMGLGDVKLAGVLGLHLGWLGWAEVLVGGWLGFLFGGVLGVLLMILGKAGRKTALPFGPYMLLGALAGVLWAPWIAGALLDV